MQPTSLTPEAAYKKAKALISIKGRKKSDLLRAMVGLASSCSTNAPLFRSQQLAVVKHKRKSLPNVRQFFRGRGSTNPRV